MDEILALHKDPIFSIIIIVSIIVLIAIADYMRNRWKSRTKKESLNALAKNFEFMGFDEDTSALIDISKYPSTTLIFIAKIYVTNGNFQEAIRIYLTILDKTKNIKEKIEIFELLGIAYYKAGFMQRAKDIFIEILKNNPRNVNVLTLLMQAYETLGEYKNAFEVISCLEELNANKEMEHSLNEAKIYIKILVLINDSIMSLDERQSEILRLNKQSKITNKLVLNYLKTQNLALFWDLIVKEGEIREYIDILWNLQNPPLEKIKTNKQISDVYRAKGILKDEIECDIFELEALRSLNLHSNKSGNLGFKYRCKNCQAIFPFEQYRCQSCGELGSISLTLEIMEANSEKSYSLL